MVKHQSQGEISMQVPVHQVLDVSVVMPVYNRSGLIVRALDSIRRQARPPKALIVVDDASTDDTIEQVRSWSQRTNFPVVIESMAKNGGPAAARNHGIAVATTSLVAFLDSDDEHLPNTLEKLVAALEGNPSAVVAFGDATKVTPTRTIQNAMFQQRIDVETTVERTAEDTDTYWLRDAKSTLLGASLIPTCSACFRRDDAMAIGGMPTAYRTGEDWLFWLKLTERGRFICYLEDLSIVYRHSDNLTHANSAAIASRLKLVGFMSLLDGSAGITLTPVQRSRIDDLARRRTATLRYQASRLGFGNYFRQMRAIPGYSTGQFLSDAVKDPKSLLRAIVSSVRPLPAPASE